jgi:hypothetical protein
VLITALFPALGRSSPGSGGDRDLPGTAGSALEFGQGHPAEGGQVSPLVLAPFQGLQETLTGPLDRPVSGESPVSGDDV